MQKINKAIFPSVLIEVTTKAWKKTEHMRCNKNCCVKQFKIYPFSIHKSLKLLEHAVNSLEFYHFHRINFKSLGRRY